MAGPNIHFLGKQSDEKIAECYAKCRAYIFPGEEDFGITPLEAMASGKPVIAYGKGGPLETVIEGETGVFFNARTESSLIEAVERAESIQWEPERIRKHAEGFDRKVTKNKLSDYIHERYESFLKGN